MRVITFITIMLCGFSSATPSDKVTFDQWKSILEKDKSRQKIVDLSVDEDFFVAVYSNGGKLTSVCFWYRHGYTNIENDFTVVHLKNGKTENWTKNGADIPLRIVGPKNIAQFFTGYSGSVPLEEVLGVSIEVNVNRDGVSYKLLYRLDFGEKSFTSQKEVIVAPGPPREP